MNDVNKIIGYTDMPAGSDSLGMGKKYEGLTHFICECSTPMTISIKGDWGTGKTSAMKIVQEKLVEKYGEAVKKQIIWFNTWEFSVVDGNSKLVIELMREMEHKLCELESDDKKKEEKQTRSRQLLNGAYIFANAAKDVAVAYARTKIDELDTVLNAKEAAENGSSGYNKDFPSDENYPSVTGIVKELNKLIGERIKTAVKNIGDGLPKRLFVFVDDLDRLEPTAALNLLEGMKNFTSFDNCVFILAVDQKVVERGLKGKYGDDFTQEMARKFFDKIIQLPFDLPTRSYDIKNYIISMLDNTEAEDKKELTEKIAGLLKTFGIYNPRTVKRSFNLLHMFKCMNPNTGGDMLKPYAVLLLQMEHEDDHEKLVVECVTTEDFLKLREAGDTPEHTKAVLNIFYPADIQEAASELEENTKELKEILSYTQSYEANEENLPITRYIFKLMKTLKESEFADEISGNAAWQRILKDAPSPAKLSNNTGEEIIIEMKNDSNEIKIAWFPAENNKFFITFKSRYNFKPLLDENDTYFNHAEARAQQVPDKYNYYFQDSLMKRATIFIDDFRNADKVTELIMNVLELCAMTAV